MASGGYRGGAHEYLCRPSPLTRLPGAGGVGYRAEAAGLAGSRAHGIPGEVGGRGTGLPHRRDPGGRQDDLRPPGRHRAARARAGPRGHRRRADRAPQAPVGRRRGAGRDPSQPGVRQLGRGPERRLRRRGADLCAGGKPPGPAPATHRGHPDAGDPRRDPPRRRRQELGGGDPGGVLLGDASAGPHRHPVPLRHQPDPVRAVRARRDRHPALGLRPHLWVCRCPPGRRRAAGALPRLWRGDAVAHQGR